MTSIALVVVLVHLTCPPECQKRHEHLSVQPSEYAASSPSANPQESYHKGLTEPLPPTAPSEHLGYLNADAHPRPVNRSLLQKMGITAHLNVDPGFFSLASVDSSTTSEKRAGVFVLEPRPDLARVQEFTVNLRVLDLYKHRRGS